jgi:hypothetical protein
MGTEREKEREREKSNDNSALNGVSERGGSEGGRGRVLTRTRYRDTTEEECKKRKEEKRSCQDKKRVIIGRGKERRHRPQLVLVSLRGKTEQQQ